MLMPNIDVQAVGNNAFDPPTDAATFFAAFKKQFIDQYVSNNQVFIDVLTNRRGVAPGKYSYFDPDNPTDYKDFQDDTEVDKLKDQSYKDPYSTEDSNQDYYFADVFVSMTVLDGNGKQIKLYDTSDYDAAKARFEAGTVKFPIKIEVNLVTDKNNAAYNPHTLADPKIEADPTLTSFSYSIYKSQFNIQSSKVNAVVGTSMSDLSSGDDSLGVSDKYTTTGSSSKTRIPIYGKSLYSSQTKAIEDADKSDFNTDSDSRGDISGVVDSGKIAKSGVFYQTVSYKLDNKDDAAITAMLSTSNNVDPNTQVPVSVYETTINGDTKGIEGDNFSFNKATGMLTVARPVTISDNVTKKLETPTVETKSSTNSKVLTDTTNDNLVDNMGNVIPTSDVKLGSDYYTDDNASTPATGLVDSDGNFTKAGTYYRKVTFTLASGDTSNLTISGDVAADRTKNTITYIQEVDVKNGVNEHSETPEVSVGDSTDSSYADVNKENTLESSNGSSLVDPSKGDYKGVSFGTSYYDDVSANSASSVLNGTAKPVADVLSTDRKTFTKSGNYLRTITFYLIKDAVATNTFNADDPNLKMSSDNSTVTYVQQIHISAIGLKPTLANPTVAHGTKVTDPSLNDPSKYSLLDGNTSIVDTSKGNKGIKFGDVYYDKSDRSVKDTDINNSAGVLNKTGTYYRDVTFYLNDDAKEKYSFADASYNSTDNSVTFIEDVTVDPAKSVKISVAPLKGILVGTNGSSTDLTKTTKDDGSYLYDIEDATSNDSLVDNSKTKVGTKIYSDAAPALAGDTDTERSVTELGSNNYHVITFTLKKGIADDYDLTNLGENSKYNASDNTITYAQQITAEQGEIKVTWPKELPDTKELTGSFGTTQFSLKGYGLVSTSDSSKELAKPAGKDSDGNMLYCTSDQNIYPSVDAAKTADESTAIPGYDVIPGGNYYREITFKLNDGVEDSYDLNKLGPDFHYDSTEHTVTYAQKINYTKSKIVTISIPDNLTVSAGAKSQEDKDKLNPAYSKNNYELVHYFTRLNPENDSEKGIIGTIFGTTYYDSAEGALNDTGKKVNNLSQSGQYFRTVTLIPSASYYSIYDPSELAKSDKITVNSENGAVTYAQEIDVTANNATANINRITTMVGVSTSDSSLNNANGSDITVGTGSDKKSIVDSIEYGNTYYDTEADALAVLTGSKDTADGKFTVGNGKTYYRRIAFKLNNGGLDANTLNDTDHNVVGDTVIYAQPVTVNSDTAQLNVDKTIKSVVAGTPVTSGELNNDVTLTGSDGTTSLADKVDVGTTYYTSAEDALGNQTTEMKDFSKAVPHFRVITFTLKPGMADSYDFSGLAVPGKITVNSENGTVTYAQEIDVTKNENAALTVNPSTVEVPAGTLVNSDKLKNTTQTLTGSDGTTSLADTVDVGTTYYTSVADALGSQKTGVSDLSKKCGYFRVVTFNLKSGIADSYDLSKLKNAKLSSDGTKLIYAQAVTVLGNDATITGIDPISVNAGTSITAPELTKVSDYKLVDKNNSTKSLATDLTLGTTYYASVSDALQNVGGVKDLSNAGTYYRTVTFTPHKDVADGYNLDNLKGDNVSVNPDGTITYVQQINVGQDIPGVKGDVTGLNVNVNVAGDDPLLAAKDYDLTDSTTKESLVDKAATPDGTGISFGTITPTDSTGSVVNGKIMKAGSYQREVIFNLMANAALNNNFEQLGGTVSKDGKKVSFIQTITASANPANPTVNSQTVKNGAKPSDMDNPDDVDVTDGAGNSIVAKTADGKKQITFDNNLYSSVADAKSQTSPVSVADKNGNLTTAGTSYQRVTVALTADGTGAYDNFGPDATVNSDNTVTFIRAVTVSPKSSSGSGSSTGSSTGTDDDDNTGTGDEDEWTYYKDPGVVTTKTDQPSYSLNNRANNTVKNRALGENTGWITDQYRTNREGVKQYRVATGEWSDSHYVYFAETP